ncbi:MAG TPA: tetratricopeptide repeat protein [Streptosporangiaceae bacterium]
MPATEPGRHPGRYASCTARTSSTPDVPTNHASAYWPGEAGQPDQAAVQYRELLKDRLQVLGPDHPDTLTTQRPGLLA